MIKKITICGIFSSLAIVISALERLIPLQAFIPLPGIKLGLSNCMILFIMCLLGFKYAFAVMICKCTLVSFLFTGFTSLIYSLSGGILALVGMALLLKYPKAFSIYGVSIFGAALHSVGQIISASIMLSSIHIFVYLAALLVASVVTGFLVGVITDILNRRISISL